ncbi:hypothetical protein [Kribbella shirazensis]|uniref:Uncharacterized protein n=1 Tax=Kribbella shirazensis TaxID=1105143 RepID=A0A7X6A1X5_9ACTN|nr:hypothetical protein [Kribbella shirazensis]NIK58712.1 hypothetical protein [Kribbella shirazensis]
MRQFQLGRHVKKFGARHSRRRPRILKLGVLATVVVAVAGAWFFVPSGARHTEMPQANGASSTPERAEGPSRSSARPSLPVGKPMQPLTPGFPSATQTATAPPWSAPSERSRPAPDSATPSTPPSLPASPSGPTSTSSPAGPSTSPVQPTPGATSTTPAQTTPAPTTPVPTTPAPTTATPTTPAPTTPSPTPTPTTKPPKPKPTKPTPRLALPSLPLLTVPLPILG